MTLIELLLTLRGLDRTDRQNRMDEMGVPAIVQAHVEMSFNHRGQLVDCLGKILTIA